MDKKPEVKKRNRPKADWAKVEKMKDCRLRTPTWAELEAWEKHYLEVGRSEIYKRSEARKAKNKDKKD